jgi:acetoin utilization deacetylase AcuC-like enzyme
VEAGDRTRDKEYLEKVQKELFVRAPEFKPFMIFHNFGHDTCEGDYGDRGLSQSFIPLLTEEVKRCADEICEGRYLIITHGGYLRDIADTIFPYMIRILAWP